MQVFKFGGASIKDAAGVKNVASILQQYQDQSLIIVVSAMGKTTNALEAVVAAHAKQTGEAQTLSLIHIYGGIGYEYPSPKYIQLPHPVHFLANGTKESGCASCHRQRAVHQTNGFRNPTERGHVPR